MNGYGRSEAVKRKEETCGNGRGQIRKKGRRRTTPRKEGAKCKDNGNGVYTIGC